MKLLIDDARIKDLIRYILQNDFDIYSIAEINDIEKAVLEKFDDEKVIDFTYHYINELLKQIMGK